MARRKTEEVVRDTMLSPEFLSALRDALSPTSTSASASAVAVKSAVKEVVAYEPERGSKSPRESVQIYTKGTKIIVELETSGIKTEVAKSGKSLLLGVKANPNGWGLMKLDDLSIGGRPLTGLRLSPIYLSMALPKDSK